MSLIRSLASLRPLLSLPRPALSSLSSVRSYAKKPAPEEQPAYIPREPMGGVDSTYGGGVRSGGGAFGKKQAAQEDQWAYSHDKELFERLAKKLKAKVQYTPESPVPDALKSAPPAIPSTPSASGSGEGQASPILGQGVGATVGGFGKRQAAQEDQYIYEHDKELLGKMKKP